MARQGLPKSIIKKYGITKKAWQVYRGQRGTSKRKTRNVKVRKLARRRTRRTTRRRRRRSKRKVSLITTATVGNYLIKSLAGDKLNSLQSGDVQGYAKWAMKDLIMYGTGYDVETNTFSFENLMQGTGVILIGELAKKVLNKVGLGSKIGNIPIVGKWLSI